MLEEPASVAQKVSPGTEAILHGFKTPHEVVFTEGRRHLLWDRDGNQYFDMLSGTMGTAMVGHSHPTVVEAVRGQVDKLITNLYFYDNDRAIEFAQRMAEIAPAGLEQTKTLLCPGGGEGIEAAVKLAMRATGKSEVLSLSGAYHGQSLGTMSLGGIPKLRSWIPGGMRWPSFRQVASPRDFEASDGMDDEEAAAAAVLALEAGIDRGGWDQVAAFVLEVCQGPNGHVMFPQAYYREAQRVCRERGILIIVDEVQTGLGRCGAMWASELVGLVPDMFVFGKALGGGVPSGGVVVKGDLVTEEMETTGWHWLTFMNQPLQAAAGVAVLDVVRNEDLVDRAGKLGDRSKAQLEGCVERYETLTAVHGAGLFLAVEFNDDGDGSRAAKAGKDAYLHGLEHGTLTYAGGKGNILKFKPPLIISDEECDEMLASFEQVLAYADAQIRAAA